MIRRAVLMVFILMPTYILQAQILKGLDSLNLIEFVDKQFIDYDLENYSFRLFINYKLKRFRINDADSKVKFIPNNRYGVGFGFASSKVLVDVAFNIKSQNKDVTHRFDLQGTTIIGKKNYVNVYVQTYKGFRVKNDFDAPVMFRDDIKSVTVGFNLLRTIPDIEFSYSLLKAGLDRLDKNYYITGGFGAFGFYDYFSANDNILSHLDEDRFNTSAQIKRYNSAALGVLAGGLSVIKLPYNLTATCNIMPGVGLMYKHVTLQDGSYSPSKPLLFKLDYGLALGYSEERYYVSIIYGGGLYSTALEMDNTYRFNVTKAKLAFGYKLGNLRRKTP